MYLIIINYIVYLTRNATVFDQYYTHFSTAICKIDWSTGEILSAMKELDIDQNTLLFSLRTMAPLAEAATLLCPVTRPE